MQRTILAPTENRFFIWSAYMLTATLIDPYVFLDSAGVFVPCPDTKPLRQIQREPSLSAIYAALNTPNRTALIDRPVDMIETVTPDPAASDCIYVDEEGRLHGDPLAWFCVEGWPHPVAGTGLVVGIDSQGDDSEPTALLPQRLRRMIRFGIGTHIVTFNKDAEMVAMDTGVSALEYFERKGWIVPQSDYGRMGLSI